jgi:vancomycin permeability regulator SanA
MYSKIARHQSKFIITIVASLVLVMDLIFLYFFKYKNQGLPISDFNISYIGNVFNLIFTILTVFGLFTYTIKNKSNYNRLFVISNVAAITVLLLLAVLSTKVKLPLPNIYILEHPLSKIFIGLMFALFQFAQFNLLVVLWLSSFGSHSLINFRGIVNSIALLFLLLLFAFVFINVEKENIGKFKTSRKLTNVVVVLGSAVWSHNSPSPSLAARVDKAVELYKKGIVNKIQLTGSNAPGELSEAEVAYNYIKFANINLSDVWKEEKTVSTSEQIEFIKEHILTKKNIGNIIIVSDAYHLARVEEICRFYNVNAEVSPSHLKLNFQDELYYKIKESIALIVFWFFAL